MRDLFFIQGYFHFKLCYYGVTVDGGEPCNEWKQTSDPTLETEITGFEAVGLAFDKGYENKSVKNVI